MKILVDECLPKQLKRDLTGHEAWTVAEMGWGGTLNGALLLRAETQFDVFLTVDRRIQQQQNLHGRKLAVVVLITRNNRIDTLRLMIPQVLAALQAIEAGDIVEIRA